MAHLLRILLLLSLLTVPAFAGINVDYDDANCQGAWLLDANTDPEPDSSQNTNTGAHGGDPTFATASPPPGGYSTGYYVFDGVNDQLNCGSDASLDITQKAAFSWGGWCKPTNSNGDWNIISKGDFQLRVDVAATDHWRFQAIDGGGFQFAIYGQAVVSEGAWAHVVGTYDGTTIRIYVNGVLGNTTDTVGTPTDQSATNLLIGIDTASSRDMIGDIDEVSVFDDELTITEVNDLMDNGLAPSGAPAVNNSQVIITTCT